MQDRPVSMYEAIGRMVAGWNSLEWQIVEMIGEVSRDAPTTGVLTAHMSSPAICNALRALAIARLDAELSEYVRHGVDVFERIREYRNQFVHRVTAVLGDGPEATAFTYGVRVTGRGERQVDLGTLHRSELDTMTAAIAELSDYLNYLRLHVRWRFEPNDDPPRAFRHWPIEKPAPPPELASRWERNPAGADAVDAAGS